MFTEESSQQLTPLSEEHADPPETVPAAEVQPSPTPGQLDWWLPWFEVLKAVVVWVVSVLLLVFVPVMIALPYMIYKVVTSGAPSAEAIASDKTLLFLSVLGIIPTHLLTLFVTWMIVSDSGKRPFWKIIGFEWPESPDKRIVGLLSIVLALGLLGLAGLATYLYGGEKTQLDLLIESSLPARFATAFVALATAPLVEEVIYRGVLYPAIEKAAGVAVAIAVVSLLFAGVHVFQYYNNVSVIIAITVLSFTLTVSRAVTGKVLPAFIIHLVFNGVQSIFLAVSPFVEKSS